MKTVKTVIPMNVPAIGGQQALFDVRQTAWRQCDCGSELFDKVNRVGMISKMAIGNRTGKDIPIESIAYVCRTCGKELRLIEDGKNNEQ